MDLNVSIGAAVLAGIFSFLSPCVLPLVPPYLVYMSGVSMEDLVDGKNASVAEHCRHFTFSKKTKCPQWSQ